MENGSFQAQSQVNDLEGERPNLPVPNQVPEPVDLSHLPSHILRSGAVETLIQQNEDLTARLRVGLRRNSLLEEKISQLEKHLRVFEHKNSVLSDQMLVLQQKDEMVSKKKDEYETTIHDQRKQIHLLETQYAEMYATAQQRQQSLRNRVEFFSRRISRFIKYRRKIKTLLQRLRNESEDTIRTLRRENELLRSQVSQVNESHSSLKDRLSQTIERLQAQEKEAQKQSIALVDSYESQISALNNQIQELESERNFFKNEADQLEGLREEKVRLENQIILEQRKLSDYKETTEEELKAIQTDLSEYRSLSKKQTLEIEHLNEETREAKEKLEFEKRESSALMEQVESLQCLWRDSNNELEKQKQKNHSLQKLNQQISSNLNQARREIQSLKDQLESNRFHTTEKVKELEGQIKIMTMTPSENARKGSSDEANRPRVRLEPQLVNRIQTLLAEVQSGFQATPHKSTVAEKKDDLEI